MLTTKPRVALAAGALLVATALPAAAQYAPYASCTDLYNRTMAVYQAYGAQSPQYAQMLDYYSRSCLSGASVAPAYPYYYEPDAGAAIMGGVIGGAVLGGIVAGHHHDGWHRGYRGRHTGGFYGGGSRGHGFHPGGGFHAGAPRTHSGGSRGGAHGGHRR